MKRKAEAVYEYPIHRNYLPYRNHMTLMAYKLLKGSDPEEEKEMEEEKKKKEKEKEEEKEREQRRKEGDPWLRLLEM